MSNCISHVTVEHKLTAIQPESSSTETLQSEHIVRDKYDCTAGLHQLAHRFITLLSKRDIANCQDLVYQKYLWVRVDGDAEPESDVHPAGVPLHRRINELLHA